MNTPVLTNERSHPEDSCERCGQPNVTWFAPSELWNRAHGAYDILCPVCFVSLAEAAGIHPTAWQLAPEHHEPQAERTHWCIDCNEPHDPAIHFAPNRREKL